jgi:hypothetical protein
MAQATAYLMSRADEIALARSAAPASISDHATVLVLTRTGYRTASTGTNGFVCYVGRSFVGAPDWPERWDPRIRAPTCDNPAAARTVTAITRLRTALTVGGRTDSQIVRSIMEALHSGAIPPLRAGAMCYMMSKRAYLSATGEHAMAHVMFYVPSKDGAEWGAGARGSPIFGGSFWSTRSGEAAEAAGLPPLSVMLLPVATWSDGSSATMRAM